MGRMRELFIDGLTWKQKAAILGVIVAAAVVSTLLVAVISYATK